MRRVLVKTAVLAVGLCLSCSSSRPASDVRLEASIQGVENGPCYPNQTCNAHLTCRFGICVKGQNLDGALDGRPAGERAVVDANLETGICGPANSMGPKKIQTQTDNTGDWTVGLETAATYKGLSFSGATAQQAAAAFDCVQAGVTVVGFVVSRPSTASTAADEEAAAVASLLKTVPGGFGTATLRVSGAGGKSPDGFSRSAAAVLDLALSVPKDLSTVRNEVVGNLLGVSMASFSSLPAPVGATTTKLVLRVTTVLRTDGRVLFIGAVTDLASDESLSQETSIVAQDIAGGSGLARAGAKIAGACDSFLAQDVPLVDIIWVMDESGSMNETRQQLATTAQSFFTKALSSGLNFRMGITGVNDPNGSFKSAVGKFCSKISTNSSDDGGTDRFLLPTEAAVFSSCIQNPPGYEGGSEYGLTNAREAVTKHLPRAANDPAKIRTDAKLVVIVVSNETPEECKDAGITSEGFSQCTLDPTKLSALMSFIKPDIDLFSGVINPEAAATYHYLGGVCNNTCAAEVGHCYSELAQALGGQVGDLCPTNLAASAQNILDSILPAPLKLGEPAIGASIAVAIDGVLVPRSLANGFTYVSSVNAVSLRGMQLKKGTTVVVSYSRWQ